MNPDEEKTLPNSFKFLSDWSKETVDNIFYSNLQRNGNPKNSASFNSLDLILKRKFDFDFLDTGFILSFNKNIEKRETKVNVVNNNVWRIKAYNAIVDFDKFNPENMTNNFYYMKILGGVSDEALLANFINQTHTYGNYNDSISITTRFIKALNKSQNLSINESLDKDRNFRLSQLCDEINAQVPNSNCGFPAYVAYIRDEDRNKTIANINKFYYPLITRTLQDVMDKELLPEGDYEFYKKNVSFTLPSKYFKGDNSKESLTFNVRKIEYDVNYDFEKQSYYVDLTLESHKNSLNSDISYKIKYNNMLKNKTSKKNISIKKEEFKSVLLRVYPKYIEVSLEADYAEYQSGSINYELHKTISIN
jgi:hypothetical protein